MAAIAGLFCFDRAAVAVGTAERMAAVAGRRGGDGSYRSPTGRVALAVRGAAPLANETHDIWLVLDGEIVNHRPLRHTLELLGHRFRGPAEAEVALHAYEEWGLEFTTHLAGAFALALWDDRRDRLVLARDAWGRKPLFVARRRGRLGFSSSVAALLDELELPRRLDPVGLAHYLRLGTVPAPATLVAGVAALAAGEMLTVGRDGLPRRRRTRAWLSETAPPLRGLPPDRHMGNLRTLLDCAVADRIGGGQRVGVWLAPTAAAGAVAAIATRLAGTPLPAVAVRGPGDGSFHALARAAGVTATEVVVTPGQVVAALPALVAAQPQPVAWAQMVPAWFAAHTLARGGIGVMLADMGAEPMLLAHPAYARFRRPWWRRWLWRRSPRQPPRPLFVTPARVVLRGEWSAPPPPLPVVPDWLHGDTLAVAGLDDLAARVADGGAPAMDAVTQAHGLEARLPFLDEALASYALAMPSRVRARPSLLGEPVPMAAVRRAPALPLGEWMAGPLGEELEAQAARWPLVDGDGLRALLAAHRADGGQGERLWGLLVLVQWCAQLGLEAVAVSHTAELVPGALR